MLSLQQLTRHPEQIDAEALRQLHDEVEKNPYFQAARLLYVRGLYQSQSDDFGDELRKAAITIPDRTALFELIEGPNMRPARTLRHTTSKPVASEVQDRTQALIETFLANKPDLTRSSRQRPVDASSDYIAYLMQQQDAEVQTMEETPVELSAEVPAEEPVAATQEMPSDVHTETPAEMSVETPSEVPSETPPVKVTSSTPSDTQKEGEDAFLTETLARIYIKQGKYNRAIEIIRRISLRNPKKNRYFADQIRFLEKLIANEQAKTVEISNNK